MNKKFLGLAFVLALFFSSATGFLPGNSAAWTFNGGIPVPVLLPVIAIGSDGNINPETTFISRTGNTCTLTDNIEEHPIAIECSNIIFDGAGYNLTISTGDNVGLELNNVSNVTVKNISVFSSNIYTINLNYCFNCVIAGVRTNDYLTISGDFNTVTKSIIRLGILKGSNNLVCRNTIELLHIYGYYEFNSHSNILYENNFLSNTSTKQIDDISYIIDSPNLLDNGSIGNY